MNARRFQFQFEPEVPPLPLAALRAAAVAGPTVAAPAERVRLRPLEPRSTSRDEAVFLLHATAEVEQALMVQYLYAAFSLNTVGPFPTGQHQAAVREFYDTIFQIAREEMGHLACMQNFLLLLGGPINFEREDFPFRRNLYPFPFQLEPLTLRSLARYIAAERPDTIADPAIEQLYRREIEPLAREDNDGLPVNRVGAVFERLLRLFRDRAGVPADDPDPPVQDEDLRTDVGGSLATDAEWGYSGVIIGPAPGSISTPALARRAIHDVLESIAQQGEGYPSPDAGQSHFDRFVGVWKKYRELFPQSPANDVGPGAPARPVAVNPVASPIDGARCIAHPQSRRWGQLFNFRYRMLLGYLQHYFQYGVPDASRGNLSNWAFREMSTLTALAGRITARPFFANDLADRAGPPFEMPYTLAIPDGQRNRWRTHRDVVDAAILLIRNLLAEEPSGADKDYLIRLADADQMRREELSRLMEGQPIIPGGGGDAVAIRAIRILPSLAIARMGSSPQPMDNFDVLPEPNDPAAVVDLATLKSPRPLRPARTLHVDTATGRIMSATTPAEVRFRDDQDRLKPVAPFLEVWGQFQEGGMFEPLTQQHLANLNGQVQWRVHVANLKAFRRTGDVNDQIHAQADWFSDHAAKSLNGTCTNFKPNKSIFFGSVQYIDPRSPGFPEIRLRYTPPPGKVFGPNPTAQDPNVADDVYDGSRGRWLGHFDGRPGTPPSTAPGAIYYGHIEGQGDDRVWVSNGYLDDACDGVVEVRLTVGSRELTAYARISAGPPTFAPDSYQVRTVADELDQIAFGPLITGPVNTGDALDVIRRGLETMRLMNTAAMNHSFFPERNISNMARHDARTWGRAEAPIFSRAIADSGTVQQLHEQVLDRAAAGDFSDVANIQRPFDRAGDLTDLGRRKMPGLMRGSDGLHLALTRRQTALLKAAESPRVEEVGAGEEENMHKLIDAFFSRRGRHLAIPVDETRTLADLFADKPALLEYLRTARAKGSRAGSLRDQPLVVAEQPDLSALVLLIRNPEHPMHAPFTTDTIADTGKTGLQIVEEWIRSLD